MNRKFRYGDGFFETMIVKNGNINFWETRVKRILRAFETLQLEISPDFINDLEKEILQQELFENSRVRIDFWREGEGKYTPEQNGVSYQIEVTPNPDPFFRSAEHIGFCNSTQVTPSVFSGFKSFLLPYILAGMEKTKRNLSDIILLNTSNQLSECISSNVFWMKNGHYFTPALESGCLHGVMRTQIIATLKQKGMKVHEELYTKEDIESAECIFCSNSTGITQFKQLNHKKLASLPLEELFKGLEFGVIG